ncbi:hypothetical protein DOTSEDRAFT_90970 [Dothistroma septosporum NZE10]|uniref:Myb-like domain-containing protein n=1 Tax=Dothistroma septosporum (strain NZE10 / CBS 128990) TaxID=675120 RepID=N1PFK4_DOTSN|nr:hypothetical protein DOTSEDRAFT_90970 [Dothistroma septosporum NZE10]
MTTLNLTARELDMLKAVGRYINTSTVDWNVLAPELGFPTPKRCRDKWYPLRDKLFGGAVEEKAAANGGSARKKALSKRKAAGEEGTPSKKKKTKKDVDVNEAEGDDEDTKTPVKAEPQAEEDELI